MDASARVSRLLPFAGHARVVKPAREGFLVATALRRSRAKYGWGDGLVVELRPKLRRS